MPSRKQRRRQKKNRRHEWEYVYVDESGREVAADDEEDVPPPARNGKRSRQPQRARTTSGRREVPPPSLRRVGRRGLIFAPLMFLTVHLLGGDLTVTQKLAQTVFLLAFFLPFSYAMDTLMYRMHRRRTGAG